MIFLRSLFLICVTVLLQGAEPLKGFDARVDALLKAWDVPGAAVAIVKDGKPVLVKGYGVRTLGKPDPVDGRTQFAIASLSKAFTATALGMLVDEGRLSWDDPVVKHLPAFQLYDPYVTRELTVRDLLCHRGGLGLGAGDLMLWGGQFSREEVVARLKHLKPASSFRSRYAYQNNMFVVAGQVIQAVTGKPWEAFVRERILDPLGMKQATTSIREQTGLVNVATPHSPLSGTLKPVPYRNLDSAAAAGGLNACAEEMVAWMQLHLQRGEFQGQRLLSETTHRQLHTPQFLKSNPLIKEAEFQPVASSYKAYGLGWDLQEFRGRRMVSHTGALDGTTCMLALLPEERLGVLVLTNAEVPLWRALVLETFDRFTGESFYDWSRVYLNQTRRNLKEAADVRAERETQRVKDSHPGFALEAYAGPYQDAWLGSAEFKVEGGALVLRIQRSPTFVGRLSHWHHDTFKVDWDDPAAPSALLTFQQNERGQVCGFRMMAFSPDADFSYDYQDLDFQRVMSK